VQGWIDSVYHRIPILDLTAQSGGYGQHTAGALPTRRCPGGAALA
jgi:hypothetical protein